MRPTLMTYAYPPYAPGVVERRGDASPIRHVRTGQDAADDAAWAATFACSPGESIALPHDDAKVPWCPDCLSSEKKPADIA